MQTVVFVSCYYLNSQIRHKQIKVEPFDVYYTFLTKGINKEDAHMGWMGWTSGKFLEILCKYRRICSYGWIITWWYFYKNLAYLEVNILVVYLLLIYCWENNGLIILKAMIHKKNNVLSICHIHTRMVSLSKCSKIMKIE